MENRFKFRQRYEGSFHFWGWLGEGFTNPKAHLPSEQFTGITDKNGKEIYEGDIGIWKYKNPVSGIWYEKVGVVRFGKGRYYVESPETKVLYSLVDNYSFEIIGNIHDNPELLEGRS